MLLNCLGTSNVTACALFLRAERPTSQQCCKEFPAKTGEWLCTGTGTVLSSYRYIVHGKYTIVFYPTIVALLRHKWLLRRTKTTQATNGIVSFYAVSFGLCVCVCVLFFGFGVLGFGWCPWVLGFWSFGVFFGFWVIGVVICFVLVIRLLHSAAVSCYMGAGKYFYFFYFYSL